MTLSKGNKLFAEGHYELALQVYQEIVQKNGTFSDLAAFNIKLLEKKLDGFRKSSLIEVEAQSTIASNSSSKWYKQGLANFDSKFYKQQLTDLSIDHDFNLHSEYFDHFISDGEKNGLNPHPSFSSKEYKSSNPDLIQGTSLSGYYKHFITNGALERRKFWENPTTQHHHEFYRFKILESKFVDWDHISTKSFSTELVSVIIPVYGEGDLLTKCVKSISSSKSISQYEVILVDNMKDSQSSSVIKSLVDEFNFVKVHSNPFNFNFALGCNTGLINANGGTLIFLNTDTEVEDFWIDKLISPLANPKIKAVQPKLIYNNSKIQTICTALSDWSYMPFELYKNENINSPHVSYSRYVNMITAACLAVKASDFIAVKGFDTQYINGCEDIDLCLKLCDEYKYSCWYESSVTVKHLESKSSGRGLWNEVNRIFFVNRWRNIIKPDADQYFNQDKLIPEYSIDSKKRQKRRVHSCNPKNYKPESSNLIYNSPLFETYNSTDDFNPKQSPDHCIKSTKFNHYASLTVLVVGHIAGKNLFGGERSFLDMLEALSKLEVNIIVSLPNSPSIDYRNKILEYAQKIYIFSYKWWRPLEPVDRIESQLFYDICKNEQVDAIYVNTIMPHSYQYASDVLNIPVTIHVRELILDDSTFQDKFSIPARDIILKLVSRCDYLIANSQATRQMFSQYQNIVVARNVVNIPSIHSLVNKAIPTLRLGMISSNIPKKGINEFFELAYLCSRISSVKFILIGPITESVELLLKKYASFDLQIDVVGYVNNPVEAIEMLDVVLSLSNFSESFGRTVAEGFAAKKPAIAFNRGAINELVIDGKTGFLVPPNDVKYAAKIISDITKNPSIVASLGENALEHLKLICNKEQLNLGIAHALVMSSIRRHCKDHQFLQRSEEIVSSLLENSSSVLPLVSMGSKPITIIIPIYNAYFEIQQCIDSVLSTCSLKQATVLLIDDCSTDSRVVPYLRSLEDDPRVKIIQNKANLGYTRTINAAIKESNESDIVLLNSDTIVNHDWLVQLKLAAYSSSSIGTVTPMSNNAGAFSFPVANENNSIPPQFSLNELSRRILLMTKDMNYLSLPTGNGFCMYIKRNLIDLIGLFDETLFPRGYGEENHFCMRALQQNMKNILCPHAYIYHVKTASFKSERDKLIKEGQAVLLKEFPSYMKKVKRDFNSQNMLSLRSKVKNAFSDFGIE